MLSLRHIVGGVERGSSTGDHQPPVFLSVLCYEFSLSAGWIGYNRLPMMMCVVLRSGYGFAPDVSNSRETDSIAMAGHVVCTTPPTPEIMPRSHAPLSSCRSIVYS